MKRSKHLYAKICNIDNIYEAHKKASKGKRWYPEVKMVDGDLDKYLGEVQRMLIEKTYKVSKYKIETINDNGKERELYKLPYYPDRIIQWAIMLQIMDIFDKTMTDFTCSSIKGRGGKKASNLLDKYIHIEDNDYCLKLDIKKFYPNVNHEILKSLLRTKFKDKDLLWLLDLIVDSFPGKVGIPIGSYTSQYFANFYLNIFDHWMKEDMKVKYYVRYMDDIVIIHKSKSYLHNLLHEIESYLAEYLDLKVKSNWQVFPIEKRGVDFVGYRHFRNYKLLRSGICKKYKNKMIEINNSLYSNDMTDHNWRSSQSYKGWVKHCNSYRLQEKYYFPVANQLLEFHENYKKEAV